MRGEEMRPEDLEALAHEMEEREFEERIVATLERAPDLSREIPVDFAQRVVAKVPARRPAAVVAPTHYGRSVMWCSLMVLLAVLVVAAVRGTQSSAVGIVGEWVLFVQFLGLAVWLGVRQWRTS